MVRKLWIEMCKILLGAMVTLKVHEECGNGEVQPAPLKVVKGLKIKSLFLREFRQGVGMAQFWQHFTIQLILKIHEPSPLIYSV